MNNRQNEKISIIVPVYNVEKYLEKCVESVIGQTYTNIEVLLIDDGSTDGSPLICDRFAESDSRVKVMHKSNGGVSSARNAGLDAATGEYIAFCDSDDFYLPNMLERLLGAIVDNDADMVICNYAKADAEGNIFRTNETIIDEITTGEDALKHLGREHHWSYVVVNPRLCRKSLFDGLRFCENKVHEDEIIVHELFHKCSKIVGVSDLLYIYRDTPGSIMNSGSVKHLDIVYAAYERLLAYQKWGKQELYPDTIMLAKFGFRCALKTNKLADNEKIRLRNALKLYRQMLKIAGVKLTFNNWLCALSPRLYCFLASELRTKK